MKRANVVGDKVDKELVPKVAIKLSFDISEKLTHSMFHNQTILLLKVEVMGVRVLSIFKGELFDEACVDGGMKVIIII